MPLWLTFAIIGLLGGLASGFFGVGGGIVIVPALVYWAGFSQHMATGTSVAVLLPPIGLAAAIEYYRHGNVNVHAAIIVALAMFTGAWIGAYFRIKYRALISASPSEFLFLVSVFILSMAPVSTSAGLRDSDP